MQTVSENFIAAAKKMQNGEELIFDIPIEGDLRERVSVVHESGVDATVMNKVNFFRGDACALSEYADDKQGFGTFDGVILANLLCRLPDPVACLNAMPKIVNRGGVVVIVTPFSWLEGTLHHRTCSFERCPNFSLIAICPSKSLHLRVSG